MYNWKSKKARNVAVECKRCRCQCIYEFHNKGNYKTTVEDRRDAIIWFTTFLSLCTASIEDEEPVASCMRYGFSAIERNGHMGGVEDQDETQEIQTDEEGEAPGTDSSEDEEDAHMLESEAEFS